MLRAHDLTVRYGSVAAVRGVSLELEAGSLSAIVGPNGTGKTSLLAALAGLTPAEGSIWLRETRTDTLPAQRRAAAGLAFVPDGRRLFGRLTVEQNLVVGTTPIRGGAAARAAIARILDAFPLLAERAGQRASTLSGGEGQLLMIARALVASPSVLLVDEPFQGLSAEARALVLDAVRRAASDGAAVLLASPDDIDGVASIPMAHGALLEAAL